MDKYEEMANEFFRHLGMPSKFPVTDRVVVADAFRWYFEDYLQPAIDAAVKKALEKREKETCECEEWKAAEPQITTAFLLSTLHHGPGFKGPTFRLCPYCGRRVVEKEGEVK